RMDAVLILLRLICGNAVPFHVLGIAMTAAACLRYVCWKHGGVGIFDRFHPVISVAAYARGRLLVTRCDLLAVHTRVVLRFLVDTDAGIVLPHEYRVAVTFSAQGLNLPRTRCSDKSLSRVHRTIVIVVVRISGMAARARKSSLPMNIVLDERNRLCQLIADFGVALHAWVRPS